MTKEKKMDFIMYLMIVNVILAVVNIALLVRR